MVNVSIEMQQDFLSITNSPPAPLFQRGVPLWNNFTRWVKPVNFKEKYFVRWCKSLKYKRLIWNLYKMKKAIETEYAREQRKFATREEIKMWELLRNRKFMNFKFSRQYPIVISSHPEKRTFYIADFFCHALGLIIEIDGPIHEKQKMYDQARDKTLNELGYKVLRLKNEQINEELSQTIKLLIEFISELQKRLY